MDCTHLGLLDIPIGRSGVNLFRTASNIIGLKDFPLSKVTFTLLFALKTSGMSNSDINLINVCKVG